MTRAAFAFGAKGQSPLSAVAVFAILADMFDRDHMLIIRRVEHVNALGGARPAMRMPSTGLGSIARLSVTSMI